MRQSIRIMPLGLSNHTEEAYDMQLTEKKLKKNLETLATNDIVRGYKQLPYFLFFETGLLA